jgi:hypothetical protein
VNDVDRQFEEIIMAETEDGDKKTNAFTNAVGLIILITVLSTLVVVTGLLCMAAIQWAWRVASFG